MTPTAALIFVAVGLTLILFSKLIVTVVDRSVERFLDAVIVFLEIVMIARELHGSDLDI